MVNIRSRFDKTFPCYLLRRYWTSSNMFGEKSCQMPSFMWLWSMLNRRQIIDVKRWFEILDTTQSSLLVRWVLSTKLLMTGPSLASKLFLTDPKWFWNGSNVLCLNQNFFRCDFLDQTKEHNLVKSSPYFWLWTVVKSKGKILQNFVAFSEYMNFKGK